MSEDEVKEFANHTATLLLKKDDHARALFIEELSKRFCTHCGDPQDLYCYCIRDD